MATFQLIPAQEAQRLVTAQRRLAHNEYREYVRSLDGDTAGQIELSEGEHPITIRARLNAAARAEGKELEIQRRGRTVVFWVRNGSEQQ